MWRLERAAGQTERFDTLDHLLNVRGAITEMFNILNRLYRTLDLEMENDNSDPCRQVLRVFFDLTESFPVISR